MEIIEKDLVRWRSAKWVVTIAMIFGLQVGLFIWASQKEIKTRSVYPTEPKVSFAGRANFSGGSFEMEDPFLFAAASRRGFSGEAWLRSPEWPLPQVGRPAKPAYLALAEARKVNREENAEQSFALVPALRTTSQLPQPEEQAQKEMRSSELLLEGFNGRTLSAPLRLPVQYHSDVLSSSVVEAMVGRDGLVISARIIESSGSARADAEGLALARKARFNPVNIGENVPVVGKLIFEWFALSLSHTNSVTR
jgi:TonB family protein